MPFAERPADEEDDEKAERPGEEEEEEREEVDARAPKRLGRMTQPTRAERAEHECTDHAVYRSWCKCCVAGQGRSRNHRAHQRDLEMEVPVMSINYGFLGPQCQLCDEDDPDTLITFLAIKGRQSRGALGIAVPEEGDADGYTVEKVAMCV